MSTKKNIILLIAEIHKSGGTERAVINLANDLVEIGNKVKIVSLFTIDQNPFYSLSPLIKVDQLGISFEKTLTKRVIFGIRNVHTKLKKYYNSHQDEIFIATDPFISFVISMLHGKRDAKRVIVCEHMALSISSRFSIFFRKVLFKRANAIVVLTQRDKDFMQQLLPTLHIYEIPNRITYVSDIAPIPNSKVLIAIGRLELQKNFSELISIFETINKDNKDWRLILVGDGSLRNELDLQIKQLELAQYVQIIPVCHDVKSLFRDSAIYVMTSIYEGFPMVLLEAMSSQLPIVAYDCPNGPRELIENGTTGFVIDMHDKEEFASKTLSLINDIGLRIQFGRNAKKNAETKYSKEIILAEWEKLFKDL
ncbi:MAG: hypothetical protein DI598_17335 [Pseudopedobacter saltans]|uniref:Glycosyl transferase family 1 domain-containing protein n=1 Tax=Pseudopedobacter saltans TaxID=151895 RepID=A0A2W5EHS3_9SPHI|nr:MAG: hypothetical protein DI598_17335 [Pseudopedobacter saltans]